MIWGSYDDMGGMGHIPASLPQLREKAQAVKKAEDVVKQARVIMGIWGSFLLEPLCWQEVGMGVDPSVRLLPPLGCLVDVTADCGWLYCATPMPLQNFNTGNIAQQVRPGAQLTWKVAGVRLNPTRSGGPPRAPVKYHSR